MYSEEQRAALSARAKAQGLGTKVKPDPAATSSAMKGLAKSPAHVESFRLARQALARAGGGNARLTEVDVRQIKRRLLRGGETQAHIGREFGVSQTVISDIKRGKRWAHVSLEAEEETL